MLLIDSGRPRDYEIHVQKEMDYLTSDWSEQVDGTKILTFGLGQRDSDRLAIRELCAAAAKSMGEKKAEIYALDSSILLEQKEKQHWRDTLWDITEGILLGCYHQQTYKKTSHFEPTIFISGICTERKEEAQAILKEAEALVESICFARDMVNLPGNRLRPENFSRQIQEFVRTEGVEVEILDITALRKKKLDALLAVGESSAYSPCMVVLRYLNNPDSSERIGLVGKGVTCDTGGYCLKPGSSMMGIKGDMAGGAAVTGAIRALATNHIKTNVIGVIPICENRISPGSLLPGDVIESYGEKTIEIGNTDAEGRLILADGVSYAVRQEGATRILDVATLTGAVVNLLGFSIGGVLCDDEEWFGRFEKAYTKSGERYLRIPFYDEHKKMIESKIADIKNVGEKYCGTITAGLFIRAFAEGVPWLHLDIAGTAWVDTPVFAFQSQGATGASVTSIYHLCKGENE